MPFAKYEGQRPRGATEIVSIRRNGQIAFNSKAVQSFSVGGFKFAELYFDRANRRIGIQLTNSKDKGARKIMSLGSTALVTGAGFLRHFGINISKARKFQPKYDRAKKIVILNL